VTIVAAPGAGYRIRVLTCSLSAHGLSVHPYTGLDPDYNSLQVQSSTGNWAGFIADDASQDPALSQVSHFIGAVFPQDLVVDLQVPTLQGFTSASGSPLVVSAKKEWVVSNDAAFPGGTRASWDNTAIAIAMDNNGSGNLGGGNASNTIRVTVYYAIEAL
jgi:hypothetical protein